MTDSPLRLAAGSHEAGTGVGCVMNVVSWVKGDYRITDHPTNIPKQLIAMFQETNDLLAATKLSNWYYYDDRRGAGAYVSAEWACQLIDLAFKVIGTTSEDINLLQWMIETNKRTLLLGVAVVTVKEEFVLVPLPGPNFQRRLFNALSRAVDVWLEMAKPAKIEQPCLEEIEHALKKMAIIK